MQWSGLICHGASNDLGPKCIPELTLGRARSIMPLGGGLGGPDFRCCRARIDHVQGDAHALTRRDGTVVYSSDTCGLPDHAALRIEVFLANIHRFWRRDDLAGPR